MTHIDEFEPRVVGYADDEMNDSDRVAFELHLRECRICRQALEAHRATLRFVRDGLGQPPAAVHLVRLHLPQRARRRRMRYAVGVGSVCLIVAATVFALRGTTPKPPMQAQETAPSVAAPTEMELRIALLSARLDALTADFRHVPDRGDLEDALAYSETASIVVAAAMHLEESGLDLEGARNQYQFVADRFPRSPAAATAIERLAAIANMNLSTILDMGEQT